MLILGIDPGSRKAGFALIKTEGKKVSYVDSGVMDYTNQKEFIDRLGAIHHSCCELIEKYRPDVVAFESLVFVKNVTSLAKLSQARGAMIAAFSKKYQGKIFEYSPNLVKSTVTGFGHADKESVDKALQMIFGSKKFKTNDESDALSIALCHALTGGKNAKGLSKVSSSKSLKHSLSHRVS